MEENKKKELLRVIKFTLFSLSAGIIQIGSFTLLNELVFKSGYWVQYLISVVLSVIWNFTLNREFTFKSANNVPIAMAKTLLFYVVFIPVTTLGGAWLEPHVNEYVILIGTMFAPVSSNTSRRTVSLIDSFSSTVPPGIE